MSVLVLSTTSEPVFPGHLPWAQLCVDEGVGCWGWDEEHPESKRLLPGLRATQAKAGHPRRDPGTGCPAEWELSEASLWGGWGAKSHHFGGWAVFKPTADSGLSPEDGVERRPKGIFQVEGRAILVIDVSLISGSIPGCLWNDRKVKRRKWAQATNPGGNHYNALGHY